eukprot:5304510-Lingulodinium_polyedra.AAC.1
MGTIKISDKGGNCCVVIKTVSGVDTERATILTGVDVAPGMTMSWAVPVQGSNNYAMMHYAESYLNADGRMEDCRQPK